MRLIHLSDWHIAPLPAVGLKRLMSKRALGWFNWYRKRRQIHKREILEQLLADIKTQKPDVIVITGDFTNLALEEEFATALDLMVPLAKIAPLCLTPGNHDAYTPNAMPALEAFVQKGRAMSGGENVGEHLYPATRVMDGVAIITLCSACPTHLLSSGGHLGQAQIERARVLLADFKAQGLYCVVALHHPPFANKGSLFGKLTDGAAFGAMIEQVGADLILHGHWHHTHFENWNGAQVHGVSSASGCPNVAEEAAAYRVYDLNSKIPIAYYNRVVCKSAKTEGKFVLETIS